MSDECNHNCSDCNEKCDNPIEKIKPTKDSKINKIIAIISGKGGVGKSMVTSLLAVELAKQGKKVGILDGDITGPSIPKMFNLKGQLYGDEEGVVPAVTNTLGIKIISINMMLEHEDDPVLWRGIILGNTLKQFYSQVHWGELDYLLIDLPPGTGDVPISLFQSINVDEVVIVTTPSKLVSMVVGKAIKMVKTVDVPIAGIINNMAYVKCDKCDNEINIYNNDDSENCAKEYGSKVLARIPLDKRLSNLSDEGNIESYCGEYLKVLVNKL